uniref:Uncharacterized protein n=1 Tax=Setaria viridis TaxID=4556 RepID=A0A4U6TVA3_SETVI|nr:hypothetical protein SEVIR_7G222600v2 [Setaria viridis]
MEMLRTHFAQAYAHELLEVLFRGTHWLRFWTLLQHIDDRRERLVEACQLLESRAMLFSHPTDGLSSCILVNYVKHSVV